MLRRAVDTIEGAEFALLPGDIEDCKQKALEIRELATRAIYACTSCEDERAKEVQRLMEIGLFDFVGTAYLIFSDQVERESFMKEVPSARVPTNKEMQEALLLRYMDLLVEEYAGTNVVAGLVASVPAAAC